ncbi:hypothetical protein [Serratia symbiotica]|uniref:Acyl carrier protein n=2 Tax=Serratia symbiotica TaxID=138074 RepID=A0A068R903_9GAMM|nr:hypothetical protein [Serratia symbiotica]CDG47025.1 hypothetical protein SCTVLC_0250 [Serratia symbiotica SCt-VLC]CDS59042.1 conserved hypothetical protein [Serratia symbiotica]
MSQGDRHHRWLEKELAQILTYSNQSPHINLQARLIVDLHIDSLEMLELVSAVEKYTQQPLEDKIWMVWYRLQDVLDYLNSCDNCNRTANSRCVIKIM